MSDCDILIVGAGPVGALSGLLLINQGYKVTIIEKEAGVVQSPRALGYMPHINPILEEAGILEDVHKAGCAIGKGPVWRRASDHELLGAFDSFNLPPSEGQTTTNGHLRLGLLLGQHIFAEIVLEKFREKGGQMLFDTSFESLSQSHNQVHVTAKTTEGKTRTFTTSFLLAADGGRSPIRKALNLPFEGFTHDVTFVAINLYYPPITSTGFGDVTFLVDPQDKVEDSSFAVIVRGSKDDDDNTTTTTIKTTNKPFWRCAYGDSPHFTDSQLLSRVPMKLRKILPLHPDPEQYEVLRAQPYRIHQRCVTSYTNGRVLLAGDAAHLNNPVGGLGLNTGLLDARAAVAAITDAMNMSDDQNAVETRLKAYSDARRAAFLGFTNPTSIDNLRRLMEKSDEADEQLRTGFFAALKDPEFQKVMQVGMNKIALGVPGQ